MKKNNAVLVFLLRFFVSYILLYISYQWYLVKEQQKETYSCDSITQLVAKQTVTTANTLGFTFASSTHPEEPSIKLFVNNHYTARVVEGCNSISVIILFWAFIIAFYGKWSTIISFGLVGSLSIYGINILRIVVLSILLDKYPEQSNIWHQVVFPAIIYGYIFILWIIWVRHFASKRKEKNA